MIRFGPAGLAESFAALGYKKHTQIPEYLSRFGLNAYEYQCGHGLRVNEQTARAVGEGCAKVGIAVSLHSPYYISLSSVEEEKRNNSVSYIIESAKVAGWLGAERIVVHAGSCGKITREEALGYAKDTLKKAQLALDEQGLSKIRICPETMGKINQLGTLDEVLELCLVDERFIPCIDFGHLNARTLGGIKDQNDYLDILNSIEDKLGSERLKSFHSHFSKIEFTTGGEKKHLTFQDTEYGPSFEPLAELVAKKGLLPCFICESAGTQSEDAAEMTRLYQRFNL